MSNAVKDASRCKSRAPFASAVVCNLCSVMRDCRCFDPTIAFSLWWCVCAAAPSSALGSA